MTSPAPYPCTVEQVVAFNRALYERLPEVLEEAGIPATHVVLYGEFVMSEGGVLRANLGPPEGYAPGT